MSGERGQGSGTGQRRPSYLEFSRHDLLTAVTAQPGGEEGYASAFGSWFDKATVRSRTRRVLDGETQLYFTPELVPTATHPLVAAQGPHAVRTVLIRRLYDYLHFTTELEQVAVIPVVSQIARGRIGFDLPPGMVADAAAIVTDEAFHAQVSYNLAAQVERATGVRPGRLAEPQFLARLDAIRRCLPDHLHGLEEVVFAIVSETLISATLVDLPRDPRLPECVRSVVLDHAMDEGRHHAYFVALLDRLWPGLSHADVARVGVHIPAMISAFLLPDRRALASELRDLDLHPDEVAEIVMVGRERLPDTAAAAATLRYFQNVGALDVPEVRDAFAEAGLRG